MGLPEKHLVKEITQYLEKLNTEQQKAILTVVKSFNREDASLEDKNYIAEMDRRFAELEVGKIKGISLDDLEAGARLAHKKKKKHKG